MLTVAPGNGAQPHLWQCYPGSPQQSWRFRADGTIKLDGKDICIDVTGGDSSQALQMWQCTSGPNQVWNL